MKIYSEISISDFKAWSGAVSTLDRIIAEDKCDELESILEDMYPDGMDETELNDLLWFDDEAVFEWLGIRTEREIRAELKEAEEELEEIMENYRDEIDDDDLTEEEKSEIWDFYKVDVQEIEEKITDLKEELENI